jgi:hypothetical protein
MPGRSRVVVVMSFVALMLASCSKGEKDAAIQNLQLFDLVGALPRATVKTPKPEMVSKGNLTVGGQRRDVVFMHPPSSVTFPPITLSEGAWFEFGIGVSDEAWAKGGDGVVFSISVQKEDGKLAKVLTRHLDPQHTDADRRWLDLQIPLRQFAGQKVQIVLETQVGPAGDATFDWGGWSRPRLFVPQK